SAFPNCWPPSFASARYRESVATNRLHSEPNLTERLYGEEKRRTNALLFRFFSKLLGPQGAPARAQSARVRAQGVHRSFLPAPPRQVVACARAGVHCCFFAPPPAAPPAPPPPPAPARYLVARDHRLPALLADEVTEAGYVEALASARARRQVSGETARREP